MYAGLGAIQYDFVRSDGRIFSVSADSEAEALARASQFVDDIVGLRSTIEDGAYVDQGGRDVTRDTWAPASGPIDRAPIGAGAVVKPDPPPAVAPTAQAPGAVQPLQAGPGRVPLMLAAAAALFFLTR